MEKAFYFLKFSQREFLKQFDKKELFFSNAKTLRGIETQNHIKGQGDQFEGGMRIFSTHLTMRDSLTGKEAFSMPQSILDVKMGSANNIPVFCLFSVFQKDCYMDENGIFQIRLADNIKKMVHKHFPNANAVAVIHNPALFIKDIIGSIGYRVESDYVHYFHIEKGIAYDKSSMHSVDMEYLKFIIPGFADHDLSKPGSFPISDAQVSRHLFCKDIFFSEEQEYRIVLPDVSIKQGQTFPVSFQSKVEAFDLEEFFEKY